MGGDKLVTTTLCAGHDPDDERDVPGVAQISAAHTY
jgi:hypothetical protein